MRKFLDSLAFLLIYVLLGSVPSYAAVNKDIEIHINGVTLSADLIPIIRSDRVYVPLRAIAEALSFAVDYDDNTKTAIISNSDTNIQIPLNSQSAAVNGSAVQMPTPAIIMNNRIMVPVRFIAESLDCLVNWADWSWQDDGPKGLVDIYSKMPTNINKQLSVSSLYYNLTKPAGDPENHEITCNYAVPQLHGLNNKSFESELNKSFQVTLENIKKEVSKSGEEAINSAADGYAYSCGYDGTYTCGAIRNGIITLTLEDYIYLGGAHGMPQRSCIMIDVNKSKTLSLADILLPGKASEDAVVNTINDILRINPDDYGLFNPDNKVIADEVFRTDDGKAKLNNFYLENGNLVIFFQPYEIGPYAAGFITFQVPVNKVSEYIQPEYLEIIRL